MRIKWFDICQDMEKFNFDTEDIVEMENFADKFYDATLLKLNSEKNLLRLFEARGCLEGCITLIHSFINPSENKLIKQANSTSDYSAHLENYFDSLLAVMDAEIQSLKKQIEDMNIHITHGFIAVLNVKMFRERLVDYMNHLITLTLWRACKEYKTVIIKNRKNLVDEKIKIKTGENTELVPLKEIFEYILFRELISAAKIKGLPLRQKVSASAGMGIGSMSETNVYRSGRGKQQMEGPMNIDSSPPPADDFFDIFSDESMGEEDDSVD